MPEEIIIDEEITAEEIAKHYDHAGHSVIKINQLLALDERTQQDLDRIDRNVQHLEIMVAKDYWTTEDLTPFNDAITAGRAVLPTE